MRRRDFLRWTALGGAALLLRPRLGWAFAQSPRQLRKFIQPLPGLGPAGIPIATPDRTSVPGVDRYRLVAGEYRQSLHPDLPPSRMWGYADVTAGQAPNLRYLGGVIVARSDRPVELTVQNALPANHPLPIDTSLDGADGAPHRITTHLHGGFTPWPSDGGPHSWYLPDGTHGPSCLNASAGVATYAYPNQQSARMLWFHDHAIGTTRLNAYVGLASAYLLRDELEERLVRQRFLPSREVPLILQDKTFVDGTDPDYGWGQVGDLWYPYRYESSGESARWASGTDQVPPAQVTGPPPVPSSVPEFFGDTALCNGAAWPYLDVEPRHYRFRILNASQARFFNLQLYLADRDGDEADLRRPGPPMVQIGNEGGFLPRPTILNAPPERIAFGADGNAVGYTLLLAPAERADVIIDFSRLPVGTRLILYSDAPAPFPMGDPRNDYFSGDDDQTEIGGAPSTDIGYGPNTRTLMQLRVVPRVGPPDPATLDVPLHTARNPSRMPQLPHLALPSERLSPVGARVRNLTLNEDFDELGRLIQRLGTLAESGRNNQGLPTWGRAFSDAATEVVRAGAVEVWNIFNLTGDTHPIHFHLVNVQVLGRRSFAVEEWNGRPKWTGRARPPDANELGWKETVRMNPGECTTVIARFDLPSVPYMVPDSPRTGGHEYVWHCHILEHEEHDMMRPLVVVP